MEQHGTAWNRTQRINAQIDSSPIRTKGQIKISKVTVRHINNGMDYQCKSAHFFFLVYLLKKLIRPLRAMLHMSKCVCNVYNVMYMGTSHVTDLRHSSTSVRFL